MLMTHWVDIKLPLGIMRKISELIMVLGLSGVQFGSAIFCCASFKSHNIR